MYNCDVTGKWVTQEEAYKAVQVSKKPKSGQPSGKGNQLPETKDADKLQTGWAPRQVVSGSLNPARTAKGAAPSSIAVNKRKRQDEKKPKVISKEEEAALKAREAAKKRVEEREKPLMGLYSGSWKL